MTVQVYANWQPIADTIWLLSCRDLDEAIRLARELRGGDMDPETKANIKQIADVLGRLADDPNGATIKSLLALLESYLRPEQPAETLGKMGSRMIGEVGKLGARLSGDRQYLKEPLTTDIGSLTVRSWIPYGYTESANIWTYNGYQPDNADSETIQADSWMYIPREDLGRIVRLFFVPQPGVYTYVPNVSIQLAGRRGSPTSLESTITIALPLDPTTMTLGGKTIRHYAAQIPTSAFLGDQTYIAARIRLIETGSGIPAGQTPATVCGSTDDRFFTLLLITTS